MIYVHNLLKTDTLYLTWQSNINKKSRYCVGTIKRMYTDEVEFSYNTGTTQFEEALKEGFKGYPAFKISNEPYTMGVLSTFMKRLPPRSRKDFKKYLVNHHLDIDFSGTDYELISHTGIQLPSDGFDIIPDLSDAQIPFDYMMEVAGTRHNLSLEDFESLPIGSSIQLESEPENEWDCDAIAMYSNSKKIGYLNRLLCKSMRNLIEHKSLTCLVAKKSGNESRPLIHALIQVR